MTIFGGLCMGSGRLLVSPGQEDWAQPDSRGSPSCTLPTLPVPHLTSHSVAHCGLRSTRHR